MLIELLPFYMPKLSAVGYGALTNNNFSEGLDRCIERTERARFPKFIEARVINAEDIAESG